ncbi:MAG: Bacterial regulatory protein arsR family [Baekduia sp.]|nr:ArsR family transcriptional regulator [Conexibacter sp.]MDX6714937.1 Bacterial regulatory protein arsR family [Baekduia sp.]MDX6734040.1 Bacterial regulatory protein arsR family [Baekduia sp.]
MEPVPDSVTLLLGELAHPVRLPVLLALEERPRSPSELAEDLGEPFHRVNHAVKALTRAGLLEMIRQERSENPPNIYRRVYGSRYSGWQQLADAVQRIAATADDQ